METLTQVPQRSWFRRRWKRWILICLALGCAGGILALVLVHTSDATKLAVSTAEKNPLIVQLLGQPVTTGWFISGQIEVTPASGHAELAIPVSGPKASGTLYAEAHKRAGLWQLDSLEFGKDGSSDRLDLLAVDPTQPTELHP